MKNEALLPGGAGQTRLIRLPLPGAPTGEDMLVRMLYAPVNPADLLTIDGRYAFSLSADTPIGAEGIGIVEAVGEAVSDLAPGAMVLPLSRGNWCRYRSVARSDVIVVPPDSDRTQAAMWRINPPTARLLMTAANVGAGDVIVQNAAASAVATWVRLIAARMNVTVIDIVRRADASLPEAVIDGPDLAERVAAAAGGRPVRAVLDCVAGEASGRLAQCLVPGGGLIVFGHLSGEPVSVPSQLLTGSALTIRGFSLRPAEAALGQAARIDMFADLLAAADDGRLHLPVRAIVPLSSIDAALELARTAGRGRVLIDLAA